MYKVGEASANESPIPQADKYVTRCMYVHVFVLQLYTTCMYVYIYIHLYTYIIEWSKTKTSFPLLKVNPWLFRDIPRLCPGQWARHAADVCLLAPCAHQETSRKRSGRLDLEASEMWIISCGAFLKWGAQKGPQYGWFIRENAIKMDDLVVCIYIYMYIHIYIYIYLWYAYTSAVWWHLRISYRMPSVFRMDHPFHLTFFPNKQMAYPAAATWLNMHASWGMLQ